MKHHEKEDLDILMHIGRRGIFFNEYGALLFQKEDNCEPHALEYEPLQYWMPNECIQFAEAVMARKEQLQAQQTALEALLVPVVEKVIELLGTETIEKLHYDWGALAYEAHHVLLKEKFWEHAFFQPYWKAKMATCFTKDQLEDLFYELLYMRLHQNETMYITGDEEEAATEEE